MGISSRTVDYNSIFYCGATRNRRDSTTLGLARGRMQASCAESRQDEANPAWIRTRESPHSVSLLGNRPGPRLRPLQVTVASPRLGRQTRRPAEGRQGSGALRCSTASLECPHEPYFWQQKSLPSRESAPYSHGLWWLLTLGTPVRDAAKFQAYRSGEAASPIQMGLSRQRADLRAPHWPILHIHRRKPA